ncbi:MAG: DUF1049 domain-containing protein [Alkalicoccus sp.]|nr:MAG: DUF1049 domain-containing protein [Alkalicoccus sp.]
MKGQWTLIAVLFITLIIAGFAVVNVDPVEVNFLFTEAEWPLVLVIIVSVLTGCLIAGLVGMYRIFRLQQEIKQLKGKDVPDKDPEDTPEDSEKHGLQRRRKKES